ncbi:MAG: hypothetical protein ABSF63_14780 [Candidatus Bathyarchaeia archaeon]
MIATTSVQGIRIGNIGRTCVSCGSTFTFRHTIPPDTRDGLRQDFGECGCGQVYRIVTGIKNGKLNVRVDPISRIDVAGPFDEEVVVWPGRKLVWDDA